MAKCKRCGGCTANSTLLIGNSCARCGGSGNVPTLTQFVEAVRAAAGNHLLDANQCLLWLRERADRRS